jgi:hypothetical protein
MYRILNNRNKPKPPLNRRSERDPMASGHMKEVARLFIWPFIDNYKSPSSSIENFLDELFQTNYRNIERFKGRDKFVMPGKVLDKPARITGHSSGTIKVRRNVKADQVMWVRTDSKMPDRIDVELIYKDNQSTVFLLNQAEWCTILPFISHWPYRCHAGRYE